MINAEFGKKEKNPNQHKPPLLPKQHPPHQVFAYFKSFSSTLQKS